MWDKYVKIIDKIKEEILSLIVYDDDSFHIADDSFAMGKDFIRFKFKTDDKLVYNQKTNVPICIISISSVFGKGNWYYSQIELQNCSYESN